MLHFNKDGLCVTIGQQGSYVTFGKVSCATVGQQGSFVTPGKQCVLLRIVCSLDNKDLLSYLDSKDLLPRLYTKDLT